MNRRIKLFLCGDVMTGRGIDQILQHPGEATIYESCARSALDYVALAERVHGPIPRRVPGSHIWGEALGELERARPDARILNLETALTGGGHPEPKGINYRMNPANVDCLSAAAIDCCTLANNHVLDWGVGGLIDTLRTLGAAGIATAGAGRNREAAAAPALLGLAGGGRVLVYALASASSGVAPHWSAREDAPGVNFLPDFSDRSVARLARQVSAARQPGDVVVASLHWGGNWGYAIDPAHTRFAHALIEQAGVDLVHGHSSHHPLGIEVHAGKLVLYGCGDLINDYEGIGGADAYRGDLGLMYLPELAAGTGRLQRLELVAVQRRGFRLQRAGAADARWLCAMLDREGRRFGTRTRPGGAHRFELDWEQRDSA